MVVWPLLTLLLVLVVLLQAIVTAWLCKRLKGTEPGTKQNPVIAIEFLPTYGYRRGTAVQRAGAVNALRHQ